MNVEWLCSFLCNLESDNVSEAMCLLETGVSDSVSELMCLLETGVCVNLTVYQR